MSKQPQSAAQLKGTPLWRMSKKFNFAAEKIIPDSFVFCIILTFLVFVLSLLLCGKSPLELLVGWWDGLSSQFTLAFQMGIMAVSYTHLNIRAWYRMMPQPLENFMLIFSLAIWELFLLIGYSLLFCTVDGQPWLCCTGLRRRQDLPPLSPFRSTNRLRAKLMPIK